MRFSLKFIFISLKLTFDEAFEKGKGTEAQFPTALQLQLCSIWTHGSGNWNYFMPLKKKEAQMNILGMTCFS